MEERKYRVIVSRRAAQMLTSHAAFQRCPWLRGDYIPPNKYRCRLFAERYLLIYQIQDDIVYADYVVDCRQNYGWLIR